LVASYELLPENRENHILMAHSREANPVHYFHPEGFGVESYIPGIPREQTIDNQQ